MPKSVILNGVRLLAEETRQNIERQRKVIADLERRGLNPALARKVLATLEETLIRRIEIIDWMQAGSSPKRLDSGPHPQPRHTRHTNVEMQTQERGSPQPTGLPPARAAARPAHHVGTRHGDSTKLADASAIAQPTIALVRATGAGKSASQPRVVGWRLEGTVTRKYGGALAEQPIRGVAPVMKQPDPKDAEPIREIQPPWFSWFSS